MDTEKCSPSPSRLEVLLSDVFVNYFVDQRDCFCLCVTIVCVMIRPSHRCSFCLGRMQNFVKTLVFVFGLVLFPSVLHFLSSLTATDTTMIDAADGYTRTPRVCHEATARVAYTRQKLLNLNNTALCPPAVHRRLVQLQLCRSSPDPGPAAKKPKHRPFRGGRRKQGRCIPVLVHSLTRSRALPRGRYLDNCIQIPLTASVIDSPSCSHSFLKFAHINVQSCRNKTVQIHEFITDNEFDVLFMTETWLYDQGDEAYITDMTPDGYQIYSFPRCGRRGGGIALVSKCSLKSISVKQLNYQSFEAVEAKLFHSGKSMSFVCLYRPPPSRVNKFTDKMFQDEFSGLIACLASGTGESVIVGDFNYHFDCTSCPHVKQLQTLFSDNCLTQLIRDPTHCRGHILDWMVVRENNGSVSQCNVLSTSFSDHDAIVGLTRLNSSLTDCRVVSSRNLRKINSAEMEADIQHLLDTELADCTDTELADRYSAGLRRVLDQHAPLTSRKVANRPSAPWRTDSVRTAKRELRQAERKWRSSGLTVYKELYSDKLIAYTTSVRKAKRQYYNDVICNCPSSKQLYNVTNQLLGRTKKSSLPNNIPTSDLPDTFCQFFNNKIEQIRNDIDTQSADPPVFEPFTGSKFCDFEPVTEASMLELILKTASKSCKLDPIPTSLTKQYLDALVPVITKIINTSLTTGIVPDCFKSALVKPLLKKSGLDVNDLKNFRPVSNLPFLSKILEKVVLAQLESHLSRNNLREVCQSAYRQNHSTETLLLSVTDSLLCKADNRLVSLLTLLDQSAAFDTIDHKILLNRLSYSFGISGTVFKWFISYLTNRTQSVSVGDLNSSPLPLKYGVPQGSVLGPILFTLYSQPVSDKIREHNISYQKFADDTQLHKASQPTEFQCLVSDFESCFLSVKAWMLSNKLKLNDEKTEAMLVGSRQAINLTDAESIQIGGKNILLNPHVKNLGVFLDNTLSMEQHISHLCRSAYLAMRQIASIRRYLTEKNTVQLVCSFVLSRLDYCNATLAGLPATHIARLQRIQNNAARLVLEKSKRQHVTPLLKQLHWLPIQTRIDYKLATLAFRHFDGSLPQYLSSRLDIYQPSRSLRSSNDRLLRVPRWKLKSFGYRSFSYQGPVVWNSLPIDLKLSSSLSSFKSRLKTHLFKKSYSLC